MSKFLSLVYYLGIASCCLQGLRKAESLRKSTVLFTLCEVLTSLGGGLLRDVFILNVYPFAFSLESIPEYSIAIVSIILYLFSRNKKIMDYIIIYTDAAGLAQFISIGTDKAMDNGCNSFVVLLCGVLTAVGGGILSSMICGTTLVNAIYSNFLYIAVTLCGNSLYIVMLKKGVEHHTLNLLLIIYTFIFAPMCNKAIRNIYKITIIKLLSFKKSSSLIETILVSKNTIPEIPNLNCICYIILDYNYVKYYIYDNAKSKTLLFHRIRQF